MVCHVRERAFRALGSHPRAHGLTAEQYRAQYGLLRTQGRHSG